MASDKAGQGDSLILRAPYYCVCTEQLIDRRRSPAARKPGSKTWTTQVSGDAVANLELRLRPGFLIENLAEDLHCIPDLGAGRVQRGETETHDARLAVVADHAPVDQGLDHCIAFGVFEAHVTATLGVLTR